MLYRFIIKHSSDKDVNLNNGTLYWKVPKTTIKGTNVIRKGTNLKSLFVSANPDELKHYGRSIKDGAPGIGTGNWRRGGSTISEISKSKYADGFRKGTTQFHRFSSSVESDIRKGAYASYTQADFNEYYLDYLSGQLGVKDKEHIANNMYLINIRTKEDVMVRSGRDVVNDVVLELEKRDPTIEAKKYFDILDKDGYFDQNKDYFERYNVSKKSPEHVAARKKLGKAVHEFVYNDRNGFSENYVKLGYGAVVDPEDYVWGFEYPIIIIDPDKFIIESVNKIHNK